MFLIPIATVNWMLRLFRKQSSLWTKKCFKLTDNLEEDVGLINSIWKKKNLTTRTYTLDIDALYQTKFSE